MPRHRTKNENHPAHPGEILSEEFLKPMGISVYAVAVATRMPRTRLNDVDRSRRGISADTSLRLARYFGTDAQSWINLQARFELDVARAALGDRLDREVTPRAA